MSAARGPGIVGVGETPALRHPGPMISTAGLMAEAIAQALRGAGLEPGDVDGLGVASFTLRPDRAIDLAWRLGLRLNWCMQDEMGGASAINLLRQAWLALQAGQAETIVLVAGDHFTGADFAGLVRGYNRSTISAPWAARVRTPCSPCSRSGRWRIPALPGKTMARCVSRSGNGRPAIPTRRIASP